MHCLIGVYLLSSAIAKCRRVCYVCSFHLATQASGQTDTSIGLESIQKYSVALLNYMKISMP